MRTLILSPTSANIADQCIRKYGLTYGGLLSNAGEGRSPIVKAEALEKGDLMHQMLEVHYRGKMENRPYDEIVTEAIAFGRLHYLDLHLDIPQCEEMVKAYTNYATYYRGESWIPLYVEQPCTFVIYEDEELRIQIQLKTDLVVEFKGEKIPVDHKTMSQRRKAMKLSTQFALNAIAWGSDNVIINKIGLQKSLKPEEKLLRQTISYEVSWLEDFKYWFIYRAKQLDAHLQAGIYPPNLTSCDKYGGCIFAKVCDSTPDHRMMKYQDEFEAADPSKLWITKEVD